MLEIPILGRRINVRFISDRELAQAAGDADCAGFFDGTTIFISSSLPHERAQRVILHELAHAVLSITGLTNLFEEKQEEAICDAFENYLETFRDEGVVKYLNNKEE